MRYIFAALIIGFVTVSAATAAAGDWRNHQASMGTKQSKMKMLEAEIEELIQQKKTVEDPDVLSTLTSAMATKHTELAEVVLKYREELLHIRFKHPEKGDESERKYPRYQLKTLKEMENEFGLDAKLNRLKGRLEHTFGIKKPEPPPEDTPRRQAEDISARAPASEDPNRPADADERIRLSK